METIPEPAQLLVEHARVARMATVDDAGAHVVPICPLLFEGRVVIGLEGRSRKARNALGDGRVSVLFDDYVEDWNQLRGVLVRGRTVELLEDERVRSLAALYEKFPQYPVLAAMGDDDPMIAVEADSIVTWGFEE